VSIATNPTAAKVDGDSVGLAAGGPPPTVEPTPPSAPSSARSASGASTLFEVPFATGMSSLDLALLARTLDLSTRVNPVTLPRHETPGLARLDHFSGLFLKRGTVEGEWSLEARTWGHPTAQSVHEWHVLAAGAAHQLDPEVPQPVRLHADSSEIPDLPLGRAANKRLAGIRRRLVGVR
jgi:hypothetical protein